MLCNYGNNIVYDLVNEDDNDSIIINRYSNYIDDIISKFIYIYIYI